MGTTGSSFENPPIPLFSGENFEIWCVRMRTFLQSQDLWEIVETGCIIEPLSPGGGEDQVQVKEIRKKDAKALCFLQQGISDDIFPRIMEATKAKQAWEILREEFGYASVSSDDDDDDEEEDELHADALGFLTKSGPTTPRDLQPKNIQHTTMATTSNDTDTQIYGPIIGVQFVSPHLLDLKVIRKIFSATEGKFSVTDLQGSSYFSVQGKFWTMRERRTLVDAYGHPLVSFRQKTISLHDRWVAYKGENTRSQDKLFTVKRSSMMQQNGTLEVFLADSKRGDICDFKIKGSWFDKSFLIYSGKTNVIVAEMHKNFSVQSLVLDKDTYILSLQANIDHAFIVSLLVIFDGIVQDDKDSENEGTF